MKSHYIILIILVGLFTYFIYNYLQQQSGLLPNLKIGTEEARSRRFGLIIDLRTPNERNIQGYYPNSIPISLERLQQQVPLDISSKKTWILVYSNGPGDNRAELAANILYKMGYSNVRFIDTSYLSLMPGSK